MTTIALKEGIIASDTQITWGNVPGYAHKIHIIGDIVLAFAGQVEAEGWILAKYNGELVEFPKKKKFELLKVENKKVYWAQNNLNFAPVDGYYALGSGWEVAMGAMLCGKSAQEAVVAASKLNVWTNDVVDTYNIKTKKLTLAEFPK